MSLGSPNTFDFCDDRPDATLDPAWRALIRQQGRTLAAMLSRVQTTVAVVHHSTDTHSSTASRLQTLAEDAERLLAAQAHQHVNLERELGQLRALVTVLSQAPAEMTQRVQRLERVLAVLHANLTVARHTIATLTQAQA
jgi:ABC-type transporter Mla maintaining outer membrane lipid asymmetry ATPase subunit MlaF